MGYYFVNFDSNNFMIEVVLMASVFELGRRCLVKEKMIIFAA